MPTFDPHIPLSLYIHLPWCVKKCPYCDFNSHALKNAIPEDAYVQALLDDFSTYLPQIANRPLISIFFGGGTPSLFSGEAIHTLLTQLKSQATFADDIEITLEANPGTVDESRFQHYFTAGVNRLSIGVQSFNAKHLKKLGRIHDDTQAQSAIQAAKKAGFQNINIDLMYALPEQTLEEAMLDLETAMQFNPTHLSWYQLTLEPNTLFHHAPPPLPDEDLMFTIQESGFALLQQQDFQRYEISAFAKNNRRCIHNLNYWQFGDYIGIGAGAHSKLTDIKSGNIVRIAQVKHPNDYLQQAKRKAPQKKIVTEKDIVFEYMLNVLRLIDGAPTTDFVKRTGLSRENLQKPLSIAIEKNLYPAKSTHDIATPLGHQFLNELTAIFLN